MTASVHILHPTGQALASFLRVGHIGHRKLEALLAAGRLPQRRIVFDASHIAEQAELLKALRKAACEIVLDTNFADMATAGRFTSFISKLPWANVARPWEPSDFGKTRNFDTAKSIADFAVFYEVDAVLAPSHFVDDASHPWRAVDLQLCEALRMELDHAGGRDIAIDYQLISTNTLLRDETSRNSLVAGIGNLPIENIWIRASGFGATATGVATRNYIESVRKLHELERPLIADYAGGFSGLASVAFGAVSGMSHGVGQKEGFKASEWRRPAGGGGGSAVRIYLPDLDRSFDENQLNAIFSAKGGRARFGCNNSDCCRHGIEDMIENAHIHFLFQRNRQLDNLSKIPDARRAEHFLLHHLDPAIRAARHGTRLRIPDEKVATAVDEAKARLIRLRDSLGDLHETENQATRSRMPRFRGGLRRFSAAAGS